MYIYFYCVYLYLYMESQIIIIFLFVCLLLLLWTGFFVFVFVVCAFFAHLHFYDYYFQFVISICSYLNMASTWAFIFLCSRIRFNHHCFPLAWAPHTRSPSHIPVIDWLTERRNTWSNFIWSFIHRLRCLGWRWIRIYSTALLRVVDRFPFSKDL